MPGLVKSVPAGPINDVWIPVSVTDATYPILMNGDLTVAEYGKIMPKTIESNCGGSGWVSSVINSIQDIAFVWTIDDITPVFSGTFVAQWGRVGQDFQEKSASATFDITSLPNANEVQITKMAADLGVTFGVGSAVLKKDAQYTLNLDRDSGGNKDVRLFGFIIYIS